MLGQKVAFLIGKKEKIIRSRETMVWLSGFLKAVLSSPSSELAAYIRATLTQHPISASRAFGSLMVSSSEGLQ